MIKSYKYIFVLFLSILFCLPSTSKASPLPEFDGVYLRTNNNIIELESARKTTISDIKYPMKISSFDILMALRTSRSETAEYRMSKDGRVDGFESTSFSQAVVSVSDFNKYGFYIQKPGIKNFKLGKAERIEYSNSVLCIENNFRLAHKSWENPCKGTTDLNIKYRNKTVKGDLSLYIPRKPIPPGNYFISLQGEDRQGYPFTITDDRSVGLHEIIQNWDYNKVENLFKNGAVLEFSILESKLRNAYENGNNKTVYEVSKIILKYGTKQLTVDGINIPNSDIEHLKLRFLETGLNSSFVEIVEYLKISGDLDYSKVLKYAIERQDKKMEEFARKHQKKKR